MALFKVFQSRSVFLTNARGRNCRSVYMQKYSLMQMVLARGLKMLAWLTLVATLATLALISVTYWYLEVHLDLPEHRDLMARTSGQGICSPPLGRPFTPFREMPPLVRDALLAAENPAFFKEPASGLYAEILEGLTSEALGREFKMRNHSISHGVARCLLSASRRTGAGHTNLHLRNFVLLNRVEHLPKEAVFETFANETYFGRGAYGVAAAAQALYRKSISELTLDEAAFLGGLVKGPNNFLGHEERAVARRNYVLDRMAASGFISALEAEAAKKRPLTLQPASALR